MAPTVDVDTMIPSSSASSPSSSNNNSRSCSPEEAYQYHHGFCRRPSKDPLGVPVLIQDFDNSCETYFCSRDVTPSLRSVIPEASPAFREAMGKMKLERKKDVSYGKTHTTTNSSSSASSQSSSSSSSSSSLTLPDRYKSSTSSSSLSSSSSSSSSFLSPRDSESNSHKFISSVKFGTTPNGQHHSEVLTRLNPELTGGPAIVRRGFPGPMREVRITSLFLLDSYVHVFPWTPIQAFMAAHLDNLFFGTVELISG